MHLADGVLSPQCAGSRGEALSVESVIRAIGVSNFYPGRLADMAAFNEIAPMVDQVETNPLNQQIKGHENMTKRGVAQEAWAPFG